MKKLSASKLVKLAIFLISSLFLVVGIFSIPSAVFETGPIYMTRSEFQDFLNYTNCTVINAADTSIDEKIKEYETSYKFLNLFTIKQLKINVIDTANVYAGGRAVGFDIKTKGLTVIGFNNIMTINGLAEPMKDSGIAVGDTILMIDNFEINTLADIDSALALSHGRAIDIAYMHGGQTLHTLVSPMIDIVTGNYRLGLWVRNDTTGLGTLTFVNEEKDKYASLGHAITNGADSSPIVVKGGTLYDCDILGVKKGVPGQAGELRGTFTLGEGSQGDIVYNGNTGLYGNLCEDSNLVNNKSLIRVASRMEAHSGPAKILCDIDGNGTKAYDIEIIKTNFQSHSSEKSMILKVTDPTLLNITGGIVQGMSGSPILQDSKIIGAVTHVFVTDPTKGFGIYIDWMIETMEAVL